MASESALFTRAVRVLGRQGIGFGLSIIVLVGTTAHGRAADASAWDGDHRAAVRLVAGTARGEQGGRVLTAGIELKLGPGWKMYWRHPGDAGVPPRFDFTGSENVKDVHVLWPAPQRFAEAGTTLIVYKNHVVLPLRAVPENLDKPVTLRLKLDYGICEKLCILVEARSELALPANAVSHEPALADAERQVPRRVAIGESGPLSIRAVRRDNGPLPRLVVDIAAPGATLVDLFVEGPTADWALPVPEQISSEAGLHRFAFTLEGLPPDVAAKGAILRYTAIGDKEAIEVLAPID